MSRGSETVVNSPYNLCPPPTARRSEYVMTSEVYGSFSSICFVEDSSSDNSFCDDVGITVRRRSSVLQVTLALFPHLAGYTNTTASVGHSGRKTVNAARFMKTRQSAGIVFTPFRVVYFNMTLMVTSQLLDSALHFPGNNGKIYSLERRYMSSVKNHHQTNCVFNSIFKKTSSEGATKNSPHYWITSAPTTQRVGTTD